MSADTASTRPTPTAFVSYSWDDDAHEEWVLQLATRLRRHGVEVTLDQRHLHPGDQLPAFMERAIRTTTTS
jgi:nucleotide-binding universal stress UspA family protein